jgi:hypothetical protein
MNNQRNRLNRIEKLSPKKENITLIDRQGNEIMPSKIMRLPTRTRDGLCIDSEGKERLIITLWTVTELIMATADSGNAGNESDIDLTDYLYCRMDSHKSGAEILLGYEG